MLRIRDVYPGSWLLPILDPGSRIPDSGFRIQKQQQKREVKKITSHTFLCSHKFHKIVNYFSFEVLKKKIWANFQRIIELFTTKIVKKLLKIWSWDPGSEKNLFRIPDPGVKKAPDPGSGSATLFIQIRILPSTSKKKEEKPWFLLFCDFFMTLSLKNDVKYLQHKKE